MENKDIKEIFVLRLRQLASELYRTEQALDRVAEYEDDDFSPSKYTPSRNESRLNMNNVLDTVRGYCLAVDDAFEKGHGHTLNRWYNAYEQMIFMPEPCEIPDYSVGYPPDSVLGAEVKANKAFGDFLFAEEDEE